MTTQCENLHLHIGLVHIIYRTHISNVCLAVYSILIHANTRSLQQTINRSDT